MADGGAVIAAEEEKEEEEADVAVLAVAATFSFKEDLPKGADVVVDGEELKGQDVVAPTALRGVVPRGDVCC